MLTKGGDDMKNNKGYTLIETLIVLAIMAILTGVAVVTIGVINEAKYNAAINSFENQISNLWIQTKALSQGKEQPNPTSSEASATYPLAMMLQLNADGTDDVKDGSYELILGYDQSGSFVKKETVATLPHIISIEYGPSTVTQQHGTHTVIGSNGAVTSVFIQFNKSDGSVEYGAGSYRVIYDNKVVGTVYIDSITGNHYIK